MELKIYRASPDWNEVPMHKPKQMLIVEFPNCISTKTQKPFKWMPTYQQLQTLKAELEDVEKIWHERKNSCKGVNNMIPDFSGDFISAKSIHDGDIIEIISEGAVEYSDALKKDCFNIKVKLNDKVKTWSPNNKHGKMLQQAFGLDTKLWLGQKVQLNLLEDTMLIKPLITQKV